MTIMTKERFGQPRTEKALLKITWEGEILGVGLFETLTEMGRSSSTSSGSRRGGQAWG